MLSLYLSYVFLFFLFVLFLIFLFRIYQFFWQGNERQGQGNERQGQGNETQGQGKKEILKEGLDNYNSSKLNTCITYLQAIPSIFKTDEDKKQFMALISVPLSDMRELLQTYSDYSKIKKSDLATLQLKLHDDVETILHALQTNNDYHTTVNNGFNSMMDTLSAIKTE